MIRETPAAEAPPEARSIAVTVASIELEGVTAYSPEDLRPLFAGLVGRRVAVAELYEAARRIETKYRRDGYVLVRVVVPEQQVADGRFVLRVVEGYVGAVEIQGDPGSSAGLIGRYLNHVMVPRPVKARDIERWLLLVNDLPGIAAEAVLTPDPGRLGAATLVVTIGHKSVDGYATIDNHGSVFTGPVNGALDARLNGVGGFGGQVEALGFSTFNQEQNFGELSFAGRVGSRGARLRAYAAYGPSVPGASLRPLDIFSRSTLFGVGGDYPLIRSRRLNVTVNGAFELTNDRVDILGEPQSRDRQRIVRLGALATLVDATGSTSAGLTLHKGLDVLDASHDGDAVPQSRPGGTSSFFKATATLSRLQTLYQGEGSNVALLSSVAAQLTPDRLLSLEQFRVGGDTFGRGYIPGQISGDNGLGTSAELQFTGSTRLHWLPRYQVYAFVDYALVGGHDVHSQDLASAGVGLRLDLTQRFSADFTLADPFSQGRTEASGRSRAVHGFFRLTARY